MGDVKGDRRMYDNSAREAQSASTRDRILDVARLHFVSNGYRATTVAAIARAAQVHVDTVYQLVGRKPELLRELLERAISGTDRAIDPEQREYVKAMRAEPDPARKLHIYAAAIRAIHQRQAPLLLALRDAAATEPEAATVWDQISRRRAENMRRLVSDLGPAGTLRTGLSRSDAADTVWAITSAELYVMLTSEREWSQARYERWLSTSLVQLLLPDAAP